MRLRTKILLFAVGFIAFQLLNLAALHADVYNSPRARDVREVRLSPDGRWATLQAPCGDAERAYLQRLVSRLDVILVGDAMSLRGSDGQTRAADRNIDRGLAFFDVTPKITIYVSVAGPRVNIGIIHRRPQPCAERWTTTGGE